LYLKRKLTKKASIASPSLWITTHIVTCYCGRIE